MVEILVVIGILGILVVVLVVAMGGLGDSSKERQTRTLLKNGPNLVTEFEQSVGVGRLSDKQPEVMWIQGSQRTYNPTNKTFDLWQYYEYPVGKPNPQAANHYYALYGDSSVKFGPIAPGRDERYNCDAVLNTQLALELLETAPGAKAMLAGLPANSRMEAPPAGSKLYIQENEVVGSVKRNRPRLLVDGWHNPIIFVPASGILVSVTQPDGTVRDKLIRSPEKRPFWASAGPDGSFTDPEPDPSRKKPLGQDNVYSFEN